MIILKFHEIKQNIRNINTDNNLNMSLFIPESDKGAWVNLEIALKLSVKYFESSKFYS